MEKTLPSSACLPLSVWVYNYHYVYIMYSTSSSALLNIAALHLIIIIIIIIIIITVFIMEANHHLQSLFQPSCLFPDDATFDSLKFDAQQPPVPWTHATSSAAASTPPWWPRSPTRQEDSWPGSSNFIISFGGFTYTGYAVINFINIKVLSI